MISAHKEPIFFTIEELSKYIRIPKTTLYKYTHQKRIPCFKVGVQLRFRKDSIDKWIAKMERIKKMPGRK